MGKYLSVVAALGLMCLAAPAAQAQEATVECQFELNVRPVLIVGKCVGGPLDKSILVRTNTRNIVQVLTTPFFRFERDCDGNALRTIDLIAAFPNVRFVERPLCRRGSPLEVKQLNANTWCVNPHRGGYEVQISLRPGRVTLCEDAGCYTAFARVSIVAQPFEQCEDILQCEIDTAETGHE